jgi:S-adenosylmethionine decarboxylase
MRAVTAAGKHWLVEFYGARALGDAASIRRALRGAVKVSGVTLLKIQLHHFGPGRGVTGVALLAESHISIHTWPERKYAALDIFMCGARSNPKAALEALQEFFEPQAIYVRRFRRSADGRPALRRAAQKALGLLIDAE